MSTWKEREGHLPWTEYARRYRRKLRASVIEAYGSKCACCGEGHSEFLTVDHIDGGGNEHRRQLFGKSRQASFPFYIWLRKNQFPAGFRLLCANCHMAESVFGGCPHQKERGQ